jgi:sugar phosphate isomerase/epimerase
MKHNPSRNHLERKNTMNRRQFVGGTAALMTGLIGEKAVGLQSNPPLERKSKMKVGLYSITFLGIWYRGEALTLPEVVKAARKYGYDGIEIDGKRPHGNPLDWPRKRCQELRTLAAGEGIEIHAVAANNNFSSPVPEERETQVCYMKDLIRMTADMGAKNLRVFLAWRGITKHPQLATYRVTDELWPLIHKGFSAEEIWGWCRECMVECARYASDAGVTLALQNHSPVIKDHHDVLRMVKEVNSPNLKVCLDVPLMPDKSTTAIHQAAKAVGPLQVLSHFGGEFKKVPNGVISGYDRHDGIVQGETGQYYEDFIQAMKEIGYTGYISYELCHELPKANGQTVGVEFAHQQAQLASEFMRQLIKEYA